MLKHILVRYEYGPYELKFVITLLSERPSL